MVTTASNGAQALEAIRDTSVDAVLMDVWMPDLDGLEVTRRIRSIDDPAVSRLPVIGLTASVLKDEVRRYHEAGMTEVTAKPLDVGKLKQVLSSVRSWPRNAEALNEN